MSEDLYQNEEFYARLAHLFYAFAAADRRIVLEEKRRIVKEVECYWDFHTAPIDVKDIIYATMRETICDEWDKDTAFDSFSEFYRNNETAFTDEIKTQIKHSAKGIIHSFSGANKSELTMLSQLHLLFKNDRNNKNQNVMKITITDSKKISDIQKEFQTKFPYLKIEFYNHMHGEGEGSQKSDMVNSDLTIYEIKNKNLTETIEVVGNMTVTSLEDAFSSIFELGAQVFRKSGNIWLQTTTTDHLTLDEQNAKALEWIEDENQKDDVIDAMDRQDLE